MTAMTALTTGELIFRTLVVLGAIGVFAFVTIGGTWLYAKSKKSNAKQTKSGAARPA